MMAIFFFILQALYFALPMYIANMAPVLVSRWPVFAGPLDGGRTWRGKPLLGANKTWRGLLSGILFGVLTVVIQAWLAARYPWFRQLSLIDYGAIQPVLLGALMGFGAIAGDAIKSLCKRQVGVAPGQPWPPFDQVDFVLGGLLIAGFYAWPGLIPACIILLFTPVLHLLSNVAAYKLGIKSVPW